ncbi:hypothetical protein LCGC14_2202930 [marine sediment metagenome]|uniref:Uncharacterized protein n=1 Tax=marine sediment metagenome TaxID=412755 RepID=A0A0F9GBW3_9ZZZZ
MTETPPPIDQPAPPQLPVPQPRTVWPTVIGWLSLVMVARSVVSTVGFIPVHVHSVSSGQLYAGHIILSILTSIVSAVLLAYAGLNTLARRPFGKTVHILWASLALGGTLFYSLTNLAELGQQADMMGTPSVALWLIGRQAYPIFLLIWFTRRRIRNEIRNWQQETPDDLQPGEATSPQARQVTVWPWVISWVTIFITGQELLEFVIGGRLEGLIRDGWDLFTRTPVRHYIDGPAFLALAILAGVLMIRQRHIGRKLLIVWALLQLSWFIWFEIEIPWHLIRTGDNAAIQVGQMLIPLMQKFVYPIFLLIWFSRKKIKDEVRSWGEPSE